MSQIHSRSMIDALARSAGFTLAGIAAVPDEGSDEDRLQSTRFEEWIASGAAGEMDYLKCRNEQGELVRASLRTAFPWARSVIVCAVDYSTGQPSSMDPAPEGSGWIARYAQTGSGTGLRQEGGGPARPSDYHKVLLKRLEALKAALKERLGDFESRCYVDTGPLVERVYARLAGIGWTGKNTCTLNERRGSWLFLGVILTSLEPERGIQPQLAADRCGSCTRCIDACPTQALTPYRMDASRCISYLTIEKRGAIPEELRAGIGRQVFGCDICQDVCPWNGKARRARKALIAHAQMTDPQANDRQVAQAQAEDSELAPRKALVNPALDWLASMSEADFGTWFFGSPVKRAKYAGFRRNVAIAMGNSGLKRFLPHLQEWAVNDDPVLSETARWAMTRIGGKRIGGKRIGGKRAPEPEQKR